MDIVGLATDYCVKYTAIDAIKLGYKVNVILDGCRSVAKATALKAIDEMKKCGIQLI